MPDIMTAGERDLWRAIYAASWHTSSGHYGIGKVHDADRALWSARQADRALRALRDLVVPMSRDDELMVQVLE